MKRILITGANSYIGSSLENRLIAEPENYQVDSINMKNESWKKFDFSKYDVVFHVAGIAHMKETNNNRDLYYKVNRDLTYDVALMAKENGVKQFIFLSSMSVYGVEKGLIDINTPTQPKGAYGKSKLEAEEMIKKLEGDNFIVSTLRPPMVYGRGCKGNYQRLAKFAREIPIFPQVNNKRSMIYIGNLSEFVKQLIDRESGGVFWPQNSEYVNTSKMVSLIAKAHGKRLIMPRFFTPLFKTINLSMTNKLFGDLVYDQNMSKYEIDYEICEFNESIINSELRN